MYSVSTFYACVCAHVHVYQCFVSVSYRDLSYSGIEDISVHVYQCFVSVQGSKLQWHRRHQCACACVSVFRFWFLAGI